MPFSPRKHAEYGAHFAPRGHRSTTDHIVVHCTAGYGGADALADYFASSPAEGGPADGPWRGPGYNDVITRSGDLVSMLHPRGIGAHVGDIGRGWNSRSYAIAWIGGAQDNDATTAQLDRLGHRIAEMLQRWPNSAVVGHKTLIGRYGAPAKDCPWIDVPRWWADHEARFIDPGSSPDRPPATEPERDEPAVSDDMPPPLSFGMRGAEVTQAQRLLNRWGGSEPPLVTDGIFGKRTRRAVRRFQKVHGLAVDGVIDAPVWAALLRV